MNTPQKMTAKGFLHKTTTKAANSAMAFIQSHRDWLMTGELAMLTSPIIKKLDEQSLLPTPALREIQYAVMNHIIESDRRKAEAAMDSSNDSVNKSKAWQAIIYDGAGSICTIINNKGKEENLVKGFEHASEGDRWIDRKLFDGASDWYGEISGHGTIVRVNRAEAIARLLKKPKGPAIHQSSKSTGALGFGVKASQDRASFSRG